MLAVKIKRSGAGKSNRIRGERSELNKQKRKKKEKKTETGNRRSPAEVSVCVSRFPALIRPRLSGGRGGAEAKLLGRPY